MNYTIEEIEQRAGSLRRAQLDMISEMLFDYAGSLRQPASLRKDDKALDRALEAVSALQVRGETLGVDLSRQAVRMDDVNGTLIRQLRGRADFLRDKGRVKSPQLMEQAAAALAAAPSAPVVVPDARNVLHELAVIIDKYAIGTGYDNDKRPTDYKAGMHEAYEHCLKMVQKRIADLYEPKNTQQGEG